ncbi:MAG: ribosomal-protein-alanine N-acetyltransferase [Flavobacteriaceae bacterium]|jgi:ribosomal-protein-alanine N-acetyltransferase
MILSTPRTLCRPLCEADFEAILKMYAEPDSHKFVAPLKGKSIEEYRAFLTKKLENNESDVGFWSIFLVESNELIGTANLNRFQNTEMYHIGCHLKRSWWGQGYAYEVLTELRDFGFNSQNLTEIYGIIEKEHTVSAQLMQKMGFKLFEERTLDGSQLHFFRSSI